ncbi:hypothetical protein [Paracoccus sp. TOH]|uniref:Uncharacterized protein n=1 Tax=Paracoccus simplex TaxID=2086346 RepID=A0ABV7RY37_9RHOB|nr:hypothetical protein [Paracoccus sp. TOH]WJS86643.1 hypothetical protein NBE95_19460 [Paracoccus sp. TOH]
MRIIAPVLLGSLAAAGMALAQDAALTAPPAAPFAKVSTLVTLPDFIPGLGTLYVDPASLPAGPFLGYDHDGRLSATIYMVPIEDLTAGKAFDKLAVGTDSVAGVDIYYNAGHPGVEKPHAHVVLFHDADARARLAK